MMKSLFPLKTLIRRNVLWGISFGIMFLLLSVFSCQREYLGGMEKVFANLNDTASLQLTSPLHAEYALSLASIEKKSLFERFTWDKISFGPNSPITYEIQAKPKKDAPYISLGNTSKDTLALLVQEGGIVSLARGLGLDTNKVSAKKKATIYLRVRAYLGTSELTTTQIVSRDYPISLRWDGEAYACDTLYAVGGALPDVGWDVNKGIIRFAGCGADERKSTVKLSATDPYPYFSFFPKKGKWDNRRGPKYFKGYKIDSRLEDAGADDDNFKFVGGNGEYELAIDNVNKTITLTPLSVTPPPACTPLYAAGNAIFGVGKDFTKAVEFACDAKDVRKDTLKLFSTEPNTTFNFYTKNQSPEEKDKRGYDFFLNQGYAIDSRLGDAGRGDFKFKGSPGSYVLTIDPQQKTISLKSLSSISCYTYYVVREAYPLLKDRLLANCEDLPKEDTFTLTKDEILRFYTDPSKTQLKSFASFVGDGFTIDPLLANDGSAEQNFKFTGTSGTYDLKIDPKAKTITLTPKAKEPCVTLYALGDAVGGVGWDGTKAIAFACDTEGNQEASINFVGSSSKLIFSLVKTGDWWKPENKKGYSYFNLKDYTIDPTNFEPNGDGRDNFTFKGQQGQYTLKIDHDKKTITLSNP